MLKVLEVLEVTERASRGGGRSVPVWCEWEGERGAPARRTAR